MKWGKHFDDKLLGCKTSKDMPTIFTDDIKTPSLYLSQLAYLDGFL
jgi:hypothetical protein